MDWVVDLGEGHTAREEIERFTLVRIDLENMIVDGIICDGFAEALSTKKVVICVVVVWLKLW